MVDEFRFNGELFPATAEGTWIFVALPSDDSDEILDRIPRRPGFGSVRVAASIGSTTWKTSLFPSKELGTYLLPVKRSVREQERVDAGDKVDVQIRLIAQ